VEVRMVFELDKICPVQFIEGRNKYVEPEKPSEISPTAYIEYVPRVSYSLARVDIFINLAAAVSEHQDNRFVIYADYLEHPTDIMLTEGNMSFEPGEQPLQSWRTIEIARPVVLIAHKRYWLQFAENKTEFAFVSGSKGDQIVTKSRPDKHWETKSDVLMLRFYGRILPLALVH
jgi:hypothetical protein